MLKAILAKGKLRRYKAQGSLIMYVRSEIMDALERKDTTQTALMNAVKAQLEV